MRKLKAVLLIALLGLSTSALAQTPAEYVKAFSSEVHKARFMDSLSCGAYTAEVHVLSSGIELKAVSGIPAFSAEILRAANAVRTADSPVGIAFPVKYSAGNCL